MSSETPSRANWGVGTVGAVGGDERALVVGEEREGGRRRKRAGPVGGIRFAERALASDVSCDRFDRSLLGSTASPSWARTAPPA